MSGINLTGMALLVVEDDPLLRKRIAARLEALGGEVVSAETKEEAGRQLAGRTFDVVFLDVNLPDGLGTELMAEGSIGSGTGVIVITAQGGLDGAIHAMRLGAVDYLVKPFDVSELALAIERAQGRRRAVRLREFQREQGEVDGLFFGQALAELQAQLDRILEADRRLGTGLAPVLIEGETGAGKTSLARWIHKHGPRAEQPLVEVNCSALPEALAESELFGHERGAFTDAKALRLGLFEAASGGTLLLDELPSLSPPLQVKVLTAIEDRKIRRVGNPKTIEVDVRVIAATNRPLKELVAQGGFRQDLYHRLDLFRLSVPPLRERGGDILQLAARFVDRLCQRHRLPRKGIAAVGQRRIMAYHWPGNVRELAHEVERAIVFEDGLELGFPQLGPGGDEAPAAASPRIDWFNADYDFTGFNLDAAIDRLIQLALQRCGGNVSGAARLLGVPRDYIRYRLYGPRSKKAANQTGL